MISRWSLWPALMTSVVFYGLPSPTAYKLWWLTHLSSQVMDASKHILVHCLMYDKICQQFIICETYRKPTTAAVWYDDVDFVGCCTRWSLNCSSLQQLWHHSKYIWYYEYRLIVVQSNTTCNVIIFIYLFIY